LRPSPIIQIKFSSCWPWLKRPVVARIATLADWPLIFIDLYTEEGAIGRSYLEPYIRRSMRYLIPMLHDLGEMLKGRRLAPIEFYEAAASRCISLAMRAWR
jgi:mandelate racemase